MRPQARLLTAIGSACAGAIALSAGSSQAATWSCSFLTPASCNNSGDGWTLSNFSISTSSYPGLTSNQGAFFTTAANSFGLSTTFLDVGNNRAGLWGTGSISFTLNYTGQIGQFSGNSTTQPSNLLNPGNLSPATPFLQVSGTAGLAPTAFGGSFTTATIAGNPSSLNVVYSWNIPGNGTTNRITAFDSDFSTPVPGPLPILGGGVAFGFSRRLRRRIQSGKKFIQA